MSLTPQDIQSKQFHVRFRGFDVEEVDGFLEQVAENLLMVVEENKTLTLKVSALETDLEKLKKEEHSFKNAMISAQSVADGMLKKSREEADYLLSKTREDIENLKDEALKEITELEYQVDTLRGTQGNLQKDLREVINQYLAMIDNPSAAIDAADDAYPEDDAVLPTSSALAEDTVDLSDLYEKIDLPAEHPASAEFSQTIDNGDDNIAGDQSDTDEKHSLDMTEKDSAAGETLIPDLDDEIMFTLEDPLDDIKVRES